MGQRAFCTCIPLDQQRGKSHPVPWIYLSTSKLHRNRANLVQTLHTVQALVRTGCNVLLLIPPVRRGVNVSERLKEMGIDRQLQIKPTSLLHSRWKPVGFLPLCLAMRRRLLTAERVMVRSHYISKALLRHGIPHWFEVHDVEQLRREGYLNKLVAGCKKGIVTRLLPISMAAGEALEQAGAPARRIMVVPCGVEYQRFSSIKAPDIRAMKSPKIMYIGRISMDRGLEIFIHLARQRAGDIYLIGEIENGEELLRREQGIRYISSQPHKYVPSWYEKCDIVLLPYQPILSTSTWFSPLKLFEAMAAGRPIVASDLKPIREVLTHGRTGLLVRPDDPEEWLKAVNTLKNHPEMAVALGKRAREVARSYSWDARAMKLLDPVCRTGFQPVTS